MLAIIEEPTVLGALGPGSVGFSFPGRRLFVPCEPVPLGVDVDACSGMLTPGRLDSWHGPQPGPSKVVP